MQKKYLRITTTMILMLCLLITLGQSVSAKTKDLKAAGCKFDLKKGKVYNFKFQYTMGPMTKKNIPIKITSYKTTNDKKKGYKKTNIEYVDSRTYTKSEINKIRTNSSGVDMYESCMPGNFWTVVDYKTGMNLGAKNKNHVTVKSKVVWSEKITNFLYDESKTFWMRYAKKQTITITYPKTYKNLCFGFAYFNDNYTYQTTEEEQNKYRESNKKYWNGTKAFTESGYFQQKDIIKNLHFMKIK